MHCVDCFFISIFEDMGKSSRMYLSICYGSIYPPSIKTKLKHVKKSSKVPLKKKTNTVLITFSIDFTIIFFFYIYNLYSKAFNIQKFPIFFLYGK